MSKPRHKYKVTVKVGNLPNGKADCKQWNTSDLLSLVRFLDREHKTWTWFNVYDKKTKEQVGNYTKFRRPLSRQIT